MCRVDRRGYNRLLQTQHKAMGNLRLKRLKFENERREKTEENWLRNSLVCEKLMYCGRLNAVWLPGEDGDFKPNHAWGEGGAEK